jgi:trans-L-3-hydroxyproline dehydratase
MCGHAIIALTKLVTESGLVSGPEVLFNVPAGRIRATAHVCDGKVIAAHFCNVPSFVVVRGACAHVPAFGEVRFDLAFGGAYYAIVDASGLGLPLTLDNSGRLIEAGRQIKAAVAAVTRTDHPLEPELSFLYGVIFTGAAVEPNHHSRNVCVFADGEIDRSATGSGVSARAAVHFAEGTLRIGETIVIESILGSTLSVKVTECTQYGPYAAIIPEVTGSAYFTGRHEFWLDPKDPLVHGFMIR